MSRIVDNGKFLELECELVYGPFVHGPLVHGQYFFFLDFFLVGSGSSFLPFFIFVVLIPH